jgi:hypothetical protein
VIFSYPVFLLLLVRAEISKFIFSSIICRVEISKFRRVSLDDKTRKITESFLKNVLLDADERFWFEDSLEARPVLETCFRALLN